NLPTIICLYPLSLHDALPIFIVSSVFAVLAINSTDSNGVPVASTAISFIRDLPIDLVILFGGVGGIIALIVWISLITVSTSNARSEEHTSELQSRENLVCRLL